MIRTRRETLSDPLLFAVVGSVKARPCGNPGNNSEAAAALNTKEPSQRFAPLKTDTGTVQLHPHLCAESIRS